MIAEQGFEDEEELDEEIDDDFVDQMVDPGDSIEGQADALLAGLPEYLIENVEDIPELLEGTGLEPWKYEGGRPGWDQVSVEVPSALALSILQHMLDELGRGIRIELKR